MAGDGQSDVHGVGLRNWLLDLLRRRPLYLPDDLSVNAAYFRRIYGNFAVTDNTAVAPADYDPFCVTAPADPRLPGGGRQICGLFDLNPAKVGQVSTLGTDASHYGNVYDQWNGVDLSMNARLQKVLLQGGVSTGKTMTDNCAVMAHPQVTLTAAAGSPALSTTPATSTEFCRVETPFLTQVKLLGAYTLPWEIQISGTFQSIPGPLITASGTYTNPQIAPSLGRNLSSGSTATINLVLPGTLYGDRLNQIDLRFTKIFRIRRARVQGMIDLYNALNDNTVLVLSNTYGATGGASAGSAWQVPQAIMPGRVIKFGVQMDF